MAEDQTQSMLDKHSTPELQVQSNNLKLKQFTLSMSMYNVLW
jgi:hypothetical protein